MRAESKHDRDPPTPGAHEPPDVPRPARSACHRPGSAEDGRGGAIQARVGYLAFASEADGELLHRAFVEGLGARGYHEGRNLTILRRFAAAQAERLSPLAADLRAARVDVILAASAQAARHAKTGAPGIPTVFVTSADPVVEGFVASLQRPGGDQTGIHTQSAGLNAKRLEYLAQAVPGLRSVAVVGSSVSIARSSAVEAAHRLQFASATFPVHGVNDYRDAAAAIARSDVGGVLVVEDVESVIDLLAFVKLMLATRRPVMFTSDVFVEYGGLMAFGVNLREQYANAAQITAAILEGARPSTIPVEQPSRYELVLNEPSLAAYGITLPDAFRLRVDRTLR